MTQFEEAFDGPSGLAFGHAAIDALGARTLATTPANYEIWVTHQLGLHPDLSRELEARLARGEPLSAAFLEELFERYFANTRLSLQLIEAGESIARELTDVAATLKDAGLEAGAYSNALDTAASQFEQGIDPKRFRAVVTELAIASRDMAARNKELAEQMAASSRQVDTLQAALQSVKVEALTDSLTGLANRKQFDAALRRRIDEANAGSGELCLLMCDIDHFKRVNDTWGHLVGDQVIRFIANQMQQLTQGDALSARYGGEEFAVIMPRTTPSEASAFAEAFNRKVKAKVLTRRSTGESLGQVTVSIGIARYRLGESVLDLIGRADACLTFAYNADPWALKTPPLTSDFTMHRDVKDGKDVLVCTVGKTVLVYDARCLDDLHAMLKKHGDWMELGSADEQKDAKEATVEAWGRSSSNPIGGWYGLKKGLRGRFGMYVPPLMEALGLAEVEHNARGNRMRAI